MFGNQLIPQYETPHAFSNFSTPSNLGPKGQEFISDAMLVIKVATVLVGVVAVGLSAIKSAEQQAAFGRQQG